MEEAKHAAEAAAVQTPDSAEQVEKLEKTLRKKKRSVRGYQFLILRIALLIIVLWVLFFKVIGITHVPSNDMHPRLDAGDIVLFYRLNKNIHAQDIVLIDKNVPEMGGPQVFVLRVVAVAGDTVEISDSDRLIVNGNTVIEPNIYYNTPRYTDDIEYPLTLQDGEVFVLADMREGGTDSRFFGTVQTNEITGTVIAVLRRNNL